MNVLSLFDGISCGRIALDRLGITPTNYFASEIDKNAIKCSKANWNDITHIGDVTKVKYEDGVLYTENGEYEDFCRYLTQTELELAQTVPVGYTSCLSYNQACAVLGNGWTVDVIVHILSHLFIEGAFPRNN